MASCETHPTVQAVGACSHCGRFLCKACDRAPQGKLICEACVGRLMANARGAQPVAPVQVVVHQPHVRPPVPIGAPPGRSMPPPPMLRPPIPIPELKKRTTGQRYAWIPIAGCVWALAMIGESLLISLTAIPIAAASAVAGWWLWKKHKTERLQHKALKVFRALKSPQVTKDQIVRDHNVDPDQAEEVLNWLVARELLTADWDQLEGPVVYRRASTPALPPA